MTVLKQKQLEGKAAFNLGQQGQLAVNLRDHRWYYTLDKTHYIGPYKKRILAHRAWDAHRKING